jgi:uncharacterized protein YkwD
MHHFKARKLAAVLLCITLFFSGCKKDTTVILPPESTADAVMSTVPSQTKPISGDSAGTEAPSVAPEETASTTEPADSTTAPIELPDEPFQTEPDETVAVHDGETPTQPTQPVETQPKDPTPQETQPQASQPTEPQSTEHQHTYDETVVEPTCTESGYTRFSCTCGYSYDANQQEALGHKYKVSIVLPTIQEQGYNLHTCERCGDSFKDNFIDKLPAPTQPPETEPPETEAPEYTHPVYDISDHVVGDIEYAILAEINARRAAEGLSELKLDKKLCALAAIRAYEITISFSHTRPNGKDCFSVLREYNYRTSVAGENLLYCGAGNSAAAIVDKWMNSTSHKNNILSTSFSKAGIGVYYANGRIYVANYFAG